MFQVEFRPLGLRESVHGGQTLLDCLRRTGVDMVNPCGGKGLCGRCLVHIISRNTDTPEPKLACQTIVNSDLVVDIPAQSLFIPHTVSVTGTLDESFDLSIRDSEKNASGEPFLGLAVDLGTTSIAGYLVDMKTGTTLGAMGILNLQIPYGDDVISRLSFAQSSSDNATLLQQKTIEALNSLITQLCKGEEHAQPLHIRDIVVVGNTAMHHLLMKADISQLVSTPFAPSLDQEVDTKACDLGISVSPKAKISIPPPVAGFIGSDHMAVLLATGAFETQGPLLVMDIGTNTEISIVQDGALTSASCASGGAFEGSHISCGMRAETGAIDHIQLDRSEIKYHTIGNAAPVGLCGSGIFDAMAQLVVNGLIDKRGRIQPDHPNVREGQNGRAFVVVKEDEANRGIPIMITQEDVRALQLAKAAISAGIRILLRETGLNESELVKIIVAGAFGSYLDLTSAITIGMLPDLTPDRFHQVGNAAGIGAKHMLLSHDTRRLIMRMREIIRHIELVHVPDFQKIYLSSLSLG